MKTIIIEKQGEPYRAWPIRRPDTTPERACVTVCVYESAHDI